MVMQFSVSEREERRGPLAGLRQWLLLTCQKGGAKGAGFPRSVGWEVGHRVPVNCAAPLGGSRLGSVLGIGGDGEFRICGVIHRCPTRGSASLSDEELDGLCNAE